MSTIALNWTKKKKERLDELRRMQSDGEFSIIDPEQGELAALSIEYALWSKREANKRREAASSA